MAFIFSMKSTPRRTSYHVHTRETVSQSGSLPAISEDRPSFIETEDPPAIPPRAVNRPPTANRMLGTPPKHSYEGSPPPYSYFYSIKGGRPSGDVPNVEKEEDQLTEARNRWRDNRHITKRGGWRRLGLIALLALICIIALAVGLGVGLKKHSSTQNKSVAGGSSSNSNDNSASSGTSSPASGGSGTSETSGTSGGGESGNNNSTTSTFPIGTYSFDTFLNTVSTSCTSNSATWLCYPYSTYAESPSSSSTIFNWIIAPTIPASKNYTISSTDNPFSIVFSNLTLHLMKEGASDEHYFFQTMMSKPTKPTTQLGSNNVASTCYFNSTTFQGYLYTKMAKSYPASEAKSPSVPYQAWPYAVKIEQVAAAGADTPNCIDSSGNSLGDFSVSDGTQLCDCLYLNYGT